MHIICRAAMHLHTTVQKKTPSDNQREAEETSLWLNIESKKRKYEPGCVFTLEGHELSHVGR